MNNCRPRILVIDDTRRVLDKLLPLSHLVLSEDQLIRCLKATRAQLRRDDRFKSFQLHRRISARVHFRRLHMGVPSQLRWLVIRLRIRVGISQPLTQAVNRLLTEAVAKRSTQH